MGGRHHGRPAAAALWDRGGLGAHAAKHASWGVPVLKAPS